VLAKRPGQFGAAATEANPEGWPKVETRRPKVEGRKKAEARNPKAETNPNRPRLWVSVFGFRNSAFFGASGFASDFEGLF
jgi:hypothetical protein